MAMYGHEMVHMWQYVAKTLHMVTSGDTLYINIYIYIYTYTYIYIYTHTLMVHVIISGVLNISCAGSVDIY